MEIVVEFHWETVGAKSLVSGGSRLGLQLTSSRFDLIFFKSDYVYPCLFSKKS